MKFENTYKGKKVLITGHTGFKGSWLTIWLKLLGADVYGISDCIPTTPSHFKESKLSHDIKEKYFDIRDLKKLKEFIGEVKPDFIFHLAAQALVKESYLNPIDSITVNAIGTANILDVVKDLNHDLILILITSDKAYENLEWKWGYRETDRLAGKDPYSASKSMAEIVISSYFDSFLYNKKNIKIAIARAGNVIGGGDWAKDRIVPDCVKAWSKNQNVEIRSPHATRPWQHVLEPLSGYLQLGFELLDGAKINGEAYNFGPNSNQDFSVSQLIDEMTKYWDQVKWIDTSANVSTNKEAGLLKLNCDKALFDLNWFAALNFEETVKFTIEWYMLYYNQNEESIIKNTRDQIIQYTKIAKEKKIKWAI